jgi:hypothetical protein
MRSKKTTTTPLIAQASREHPSIPSPRNNFNIAITGRQLAGLGEALAVYYRIERAVIAQFSSWGPGRVNFVVDCGTGWFIRC